jgi:hypothetical protein
MRCGPVKVGETPAGEADRGIVVMWSTGYYGHLSDYLWWWVALLSLGVHTWCFFRLFPRSRLPKVRLVAGNLLVGICMLTFVGLIAESYLRFLHVETDSFGVTLTSKRWFALYPRLNSLSHRDEEWTERKPAGVRRIAFVGDSFTYGWGIENVEDRFSNLLEARLNGSGQAPVEVMNWAWADWDTRDHIKAVYQAVTDYDVDEVVLCHLPNDIEQLLPTTEDFDPIHPPRSGWINTDSSFLLDFLYHRIYARRLASVRDYFDWLADGYADPRIWHEQEERFARIIAYCRENGVMFRVALLPFIRTNGDRYDPELIHAALRKFFEVNGIPVVDLLPCIREYRPEELEVNSHDHHPNELANRLFAGAIWNAFYGRPED